MVPLASTISKKYKRAVIEQKESQDYFEELNKAAPQELIPVWTAQIEKAERDRANRPEAMDIMKNQVKKGLFAF